MSGAWQFRRLLLRFQFRTGALFGAIGQSLRFGEKSCERPYFALLARLSDAQDKPPHHLSSDAVLPPFVAGDPTLAFVLSHAAFHRGVEHQSSLGSALWRLLQLRQRQFPLLVPYQHFASQ